jgi:hypothetical protein
MVWRMTRTASLAQICSAVSTRVLRMASVLAAAATRFEDGVRGVGGRGLEPELGVRPPRAGLPIREGEPSPLTAHG